MRTAVSASNYFQCFTQEDDKVTLVAEWQKGGWFGNITTRCHTVEEVAADCPLASGAFLGCM